MHDNSCGGRILVYIMSSYMTTVVSYISVYDNRCVLDIYMYDDNSVFDLSV